MKKHLRIATAAFSVLALALVGCEDGAGTDDGLGDNGVEDTGEGEDLGEDLGEGEDDA